MEISNFLQLLSRKNKKEASKKAYVIDTSTIIHDPNCLTQFKDNDIFLPYITISELDALRTKKNGRGRAAREAIRYLENIRSNNGYIDGQILPGGGSIYIIGNSENVYREINSEFKKHDDTMLDVTREFMAKNKDVYKQIILISKDIGMRIKASAMGILCENYERSMIFEENIYNGIYKDNIELHTEDFDKLKKDGIVPYVNEELLENQFVLVKSNKKSYTITRYKTINNEKFLKISEGDINISGIKSKNLRQNMAIDLLCDPTIHVVALVGPAGTGKTCLSLASALSQVDKKDKYVYHQIICIKPIVPVGEKDIGFLPGSKDEKLIPWLAPFMDNLKYIGSINGRFDYAEELIESGVIELETMTYMRGRSIPNSFIIVDEVQNMTPQEVKTALSRAGSGTKVVLLADPTQIDTPYLDKESCGMTHLIDRFKGQKTFGVVELDKSERSEVAKLAAELL